MSEVGNSQQSRPYTLGFTIAVVVILIIGMIHCWRRALKQVKKWVNNGVETIPVEISVFIEDRRISSAPVCDQHFQMILKHEDESSPKKKKKHLTLEKSQINNLKQPRVKFTKSCETSRTHSHSFKKCDQRESEGNFFAGYSHLNNDF